MFGKSWGVKIDNEVKKAISRRHICMLGDKKKDDCLTTLLDLVRPHGAIEEFESMKEKVLAREKLMSTGIGLGLGLPHARVEGIKKPVVAIGISPQGVHDYESIDGQPVRIIILIVTGKTQHKDYVKILSYMIAVIKNTEVKEKLINAQDPKQIYGIFMKELASVYKREIT